MYDRKLRFMGGPFTATKVGDEDDRKRVLSRGNLSKTKARKLAIANVQMKDGSKKKVKVRTVVETPMNRHYARQNIMVKGAVIDTEVGHARITNRVGQDGIVNAIQI